MLQRLLHQMKIAPPTSKNLSKISKSTPLNRKLKRAVWLWKVDRALTHLRRRVKALRRHLRKARHHRKSTWLPLISRQVSIPALSSLVNLWAPSKSSRTAMMVLLKSSSQKNHFNSYRSSLESAPIHPLRACSSFSQLWSSPATPRRNRLQAPSRPASSSAMRVSSREGSAENLEQSLQLLEILHNRIANSSNSEPHWVGRQLRSSTPKSAITSRSRRYHRLSTLTASDKIRLEVNEILNKKRQVPTRGLPNQSLSFRVVKWN